jgi:anti-sigma regulatory factor (Ser/Thr protein kinase)
LSADIVLVVNEACTNCIEHAYGAGDAGTMLLEVEAVDSEVRVRVADSGSWKTPAANPGNSGRGLLLIRAISDAVELDSTPSGTTVEISFRLPAEYVSAH